jgi:hypothetical protein
LDYLPEEKTIIMDINLANIIGNDVLPKELLASLQEAFDTKVQEAREQAEIAIREELAQRYEHDKDALVEAMDQAITAVVQTYESQKSDEISKLREAQEKFQNGLKEAKAEYRSKLKEHLSNASSFIAKQLSEEVKPLRSERRGLKEARVQVAEEVAQLKAKLSEAHNTHVKKIDEFVVRQVTTELAEFGQDRRALVETRAKLISENRKRLKETQQRFVTESAKKLDQVISETLSNEMTQLHEDLERNRQNNFGRKIFEAIAAEFMSSYYADGTETRKVQGILETTQSELETAQTKLAESERVSEAAARKARLAEDRAERSKIMSELLSNLRGEKRAVMEGMLESVKTPELRKSFERFLPMVLNEQKKSVPKSQILSEDKARQSRVVTGDSRPNRLIESVQASDETELTEELAQVVRLAGIHKN